MIDLARLNAISLHKEPLGQRIVARIMLMPNYSSPFTRTEIILEGVENIPANGGAIFVMNHTDRFNYWPFQYKLWKDGLGFTATWVKGKYYESKLMGKFMDLTNNIPVPSKGYVLSKDFVLAMKRTPTNTEYEVLKSLTDGKISEDQAKQQGGPSVERFLQRTWPDSPEGKYADSLERRFNAMMERVVEINKEGLAKGLNLLIFPQGTRSVRLTKGHTGAAQMILHTGAPVIPVGCNGSDLAYPGNSPLSSGGKIVYRIGKPLTVDQELKPFQIKEPFMPFTHDAEKHNPQFRKLTGYLMDRINDLLDPRYKYADDVELEKGARRFL